MKIETEFNIGDIVWMAYGSKKKPIKQIITKIDISINTCGAKIVYHTPYASRRGYELFESEEELLESLKNG